MRDKEFLLWRADRLEHVYGEDKDIDFIGKLVSIANGLSEQQTTPNMGSRRKWKKNNLR